MEWVHEQVHGMPKGVLWRGLSHYQPKYDFFYINFKLLQVSWKKFSEDEEIKKGRKAEEEKSFTWTQKSTHFIASVTHSLRTGLKNAKTWIGISKSIKKRSILRQIIRFTEIIRLNSIWFDLFLFKKSLDWPFVKDGINFPEYLFFFFISARNETRKTVL